MSNPPDALSIQVAQAVTDFLNAHTYAQPFTAARVSIPIIEPEDVFNTLVVLVAPGSESCDVNSRISETNTIIVQVAFVKDLHGVTNTLVDPMCALVRQVADALSFLGMAGCWWIGSERKPLYSAKDLKEKQRFFGLITLTYKADTQVAASQT
jgi:hypothetical protein